MDEEIILEALKKMESGGLVECLDGNLYRLTTAGLVYGYTELIRFMSLFSHGPSSVLLLIALMVVSGFLLKLLQKIGNPKLLLKILQRRSPNALPS